MPMIQYHYIFEIHVNITFIYDSPFTEIIHFYSGGQRGLDIKNI